MPLRPITLAAVAGLLALCLAQAAAARTVELPAAAPVATVEIPDDWTLVEVARGIEARSPDDEVALWIEAYLPEDYLELVAEHAAFLRSEDIAIVSAPRTDTHTEDGMTARFTDFDATWRGATTILWYTVFDFGLPDRKQVLMTLWASPDGHATHEAAVGSIIGSLVQGAK